MAAGQIIVPGAMPTRDRNGRATVGKLFFYEDGTQTPAPVYTTSALTIELANPVVSDAAGRFPSIWADDAELFTVVWTYDDEETIKTYSGVSAAEDAVLASVALAEAAADEAAADAVQTAADLAAIQAIEAAGSTAPAIAGKLDRDGSNVGIYASDLRTNIAVVGTAALAASSGSSLMGFLQAGTGAVARTMQAKARDRISVLDFGAVGDGTTDDTAEIQAAITAAATAGKSLRIPGTTAYYRISDDLIVPAGSRIEGEGWASRIVQVTSGTNAITATGDNIHISGVAIVGTNTALSRGIAVSAANNVTIEKCQIKNFLNGIYVTGVCHDVGILNNRLWGGIGDAGPAADIQLYGTDSTNGTVRRARIIGNHCLSNNDTGISVNTNNGDREIIITNNIVVPCDADGVSERAADNNVKLRFGINLGYVGGQEGRCVIGNNIVRRVGYSGIYLQGTASPSGTCSVVGNVVSECGYSTLYPSDASLRAGIYLATGGADTVTGNVIVACSTTGLKLSPTAGPGANSPRASITGNTIARTAGDGVVFSNSPYGYLFASNRVYGSTGIAVQFTPTTPADSGDCVFDGNHIQTTGTAGAFQILGASIGAPVVVSNNVMVGDSPSTSSVFNSGVYTSGSPDDVVIKGNTIKGYNRGINMSTALNTREINGPSNNHISGGAFGILGVGTGTLLCQGNTFDGVTEPTYNTACNGILLNSIYQTAGQILTGNFDGSAPAYGTWARGDQCMNPVPSAGGIPGWVCVTAGSPGTWKAMAAIAS